MERKQNAIWSSRLGTSSFDRRTFQAKGTAQTKGKSTKGCGEDGGGLVLLRWGEGGGIDQGNQKRQARKEIWGQTSGAVEECYAEGEFPIASVIEGYGQHSVDGGLECRAVLHVG